MTNRVEATSYQPFDDLNLGYRLVLTQQGNQLTGSGYKWMENGRQLPSSQRTAIAVAGTVDGRTVQLHFTEHGHQRESAGTFTYEITDAEVMQGRFRTSAADSSGSTQARRMPWPE